MEELLAARLQMAFTLGFHIILACFGVGLPLLMLAAEAKYLQTKDTIFLTMAKRWSKAFAVLFAVGAVSGTVLSFELGLLWPKFMGTFGSVISLPFTLEGFAFFLEAIFVGIYIYGWNKLSPAAHFLCGFPIAISGFASAWFVVTANSWMNSPQGFDWVDGKVINPQPLVAMFNQTTWAQTTHMILAAYIVSGFSVASFYAWRLMWHGSPSRAFTPKWHGSPSRAVTAMWHGSPSRAPNNHHTKRYNQIAMSLGLILGCSCMLPQMIVGDWSAKVVAKTQPIKLAAMESHFKTEVGAPLVVGGYPDMETQTVKYSLKIPKLLSFLAYGDLNAEVRGLEEFPPDEIPPVPIVHIAFQLMVGTGTLLMLFSGVAFARWLFNRRAEFQETFFQPRWFLWFTVLTGPMAVIALEAGWTVTEVGRQPWIVYGIMRTKDAVTSAPGINTIFFVTMLIYAVLLIGSVSVLRFLSQKPIEPI